MRNVNYFWLVCCNIQSKVIFWWRKKLEFLFFLQVSCCERSTQTQTVKLKFLTSLSLETRLSSRQDLFRDKMSSSPNHSPSHWTRAKVPANGALIKVRQFMSPDSPCSELVYSVVYRYQLIVEIRQSHTLN